jgi:TPR repeat protein
MVAGCVRGEFALKRRIITFFASGVLALALFGIAKAGPLEDAQTALDRKDYRVALQLVIPLTKEGNAHAQYILGQIYLYGLGVSKDSGEGVRWILSAAEGNDREAEYLVGWWYDAGNC